MSLEFKTIEDDREWDSLVQSLPKYSFLNSSCRYRFNLEVGSKSYRYAIYDKEAFLGIITLTIGYSKLFGNFLECKHSPLLFKYEYSTLEEITEFCKNLAKENNCFMFRFAPLIQENEDLEKFYNEHEFKKAPIHNVDALISQHMDLTLDIAELRHQLSSSRKNRLNKLLRDETVSVKIYNDKTAFDDFRKFHEETVALKGYTDKPTDILMKELSMQEEQGMCYMIVGCIEDKPISIWQATVYGKNMHLYQACSSTEYREKNQIMTTLLYWKTVELGQSLHLETLDLFGGVVPKGWEHSSHPWSGISDFKESLGGEKITYMHSRDYMLNKPKYWLYYWYSYIRTRKKGYTIDW
ncbi:peptidoglycan bridge formation glycyltransferase FemA/FemB family protein [bacterium]|nr:peptidoglycan bridge formation glycyltransferase FemA/FemB family protein [bacterium]